MCLVEDCKYGNNLALAWDVLITCKYELNFEEGNVAGNWDDLFVDPSSGSIDSQISDEFDDTELSRDSVRNSMATERAHTDGTIDNVESKMIGQSVSSLSTPEETVASAAWSEHYVMCSIHTGSFQQMPSLRVCIKRKQKDSNCTSNAIAARKTAELSNQSCKQKFRSVVFRKVSWILRKVNTGLNCIIGIFLVIPWMRNKLNRRSLMTRESNSC